MEAAAVADNIRVPSAVWLSEWDRYARQHKVEYAKRECERMIEAGEPVVHLAVLLPLPQQQDAVFSALRSLDYVPKIRMRRGAVPPPNRPNGHLGIPAAKRGKVLYAKTGMLGPSEENPGKAESDKWSGPGRQNQMQRMQPLVREREITHEAVSVPLGDANVILRQWGVATHIRRMTPLCEIRKDSEGRQYKYVDEQGMDRWIVEEVTDAMLAREHEDDPKPPSPAAPAAPIPINRKARAERMAA